ncbi:RNA polymerase sigma factor [Paraclostridium sordellii]
MKYYLGGENPQDIAKENNITISSLYSRLSRGRKKIRESMGK